MKFFSLVLFVFLFVLGCSQQNDPYELSIDKWHQLRIDSLKGETGFINLAGLYWLEEGINTFGSDTSNAFDFTDKSAPKMGSFLLMDSLVYLVPTADILIEGKIVEDTTLVFGNGVSSNMKYRSLFWIVIKRGNRIGLRLRDFESDLLDNFDSIDYYETDVDWKIAAQWVSYEVPKEVVFSNVIGASIPYKIHGYFSFKRDDTNYKLEPLGQPDEYGYFVMFYDKSSAETTYGSGRYIYVDKPSNSNSTFIDFNKAYNPPCAFTAFATCLFPHKANRLPFFVNAGEKFSGH